MENIALESDKQKQFLKSIKGIKQLIKKGNEPKIKKAPIEKTQDVKTTKVKKRKRKERGLVYLSHIPHGFYEHEMTQYFKQFGVVTNVRVIRSKRTGTSKGYAFVEFRDPAVGQIVAETMNNYLMGKRLIKAAYIPPEKQKRHTGRKRWNPLNNPGRDARLKIRKAYNAIKDEKEELKQGKRILESLSRKRKQLEKLNINYDFFQPVDVPDALKNIISSKEKEESVEVNKDNKVSKSKKPKKEEVTVDTEVKEESEIKPDIKSNGKGKTVEVKQNKSNIVVKESSNKKKGKKEPISLIDSKLVKGEKEESVEVASSKSKKKSKKGKVIIETEMKKEPETKSDIKLNGKGKTVEVKKNKLNVGIKESSNKQKGKKESVTTSHLDVEQAAKKKKINEALVKPLEDFIQIEQDSDTDSPYEFDSDEYEKFMENDGDESDYSGNDDDDSQDISNNSGSNDEAVSNTDSDEEGSEEVTPPRKGRVPMVLAPMQLKKHLGKQDIKTEAPKQMKRKAQKTESTPKKFKSEKQVQKPMKKQFKRKK